MLPQAPVLTVTPALLRFSGEVFAEKCFAPEMVCGSCMRLQISAEPWLTTNLIALPTSQCGAGSDLAALIERSIEAPQKHCSRLGCNEIPCCIASRRWWIVIGEFSETF